MPNKFPETMFNKFPEGINTLFNHSLENKEPEITNLEGLVTCNNLNLEALIEKLPLVLNEINTYVLAEMNFEDLKLFLKHGLFLKAQEFGETGLPSGPEYHTAKQTYQNNLDLATSVLTEKQKKMFDRLVCLYNPLIDIRRLPNDGEILKVLDNLIDLQRKYNMLIKEQKLEDLRRYLETVQETAPA